MRQRWPISAAVAFVAWFCAIYLVAAQDSLNTRDQTVLQIQELIDKHEPAKADKLLDEAVKQFPADAGFDNLRGIVDVQLGKPAEAENSFIRATQRSPKFTGAYLNLGRLYQENSSFDSQAGRKALEIYARVLNYESTNEEARYQSAALLLKQGKFQESLVHLSKLPEEIKGRAQILSIFCADYAAIGNRQAADDAVRRLQGDSGFSAADAQQALFGLRAGKRDDLIIVLLEALQKRAALSDPLLHALGLAYEQGQQLAEARRALEQSLTAENLSTGLLLELARVAHKQGDYKGSLGYLAHAREIAPNDARIHYDFGLVCLDMNLLAEAGNAFEKAVKLEPDNASFNYMMGSVAAFRHDPAEAVPFFQKYLQLKPDDPQGKLALGTVFFRARDFDAALPWLTQAGEADVTAAKAHYYLGSIALQQRHLDNAFRELQLALKSKPDYANALAELGQYYLINKNYPDAEKYIRRALDLDPDYLAANLYLVTLYTRTGDSRKEAQVKHFEELQKLREEKAQDLTRIVEVRPFESP